MVLFICMAVHKSFNWCWKLFTLDLLKGALGHYKIYPIQHYGLIKLCIGISVIKISNSILVPCPPGSQQFSSDDHKFINKLLPFILFTVYRNESTSSVRSWEAEGKQSLGGFSLFLKFMNNAKKKIDVENILLMNFYCSRLFASASSSGK